VPNLDHRFREEIEEHYGHQLAEIRELAAQLGAPPKLTIEIGSNRGRFLAALAAQNPERTYVGIEIRKQYADTAQRRLERRGLDNAHILRADANHVLPILCDEDELDELFVLFPDPWWKARHRKRRIIQPDFLDMLSPRMRSDGHLWVRTDVGPFATDMRDHLETHPDFEALPFFDYPLEPFPLTTRERHIIDEGLPIHLLYYLRT
jgi:tRNA (guanine-N7-)-methyltransferase